MTEVKSTFMSKISPSMLLAVFAMIGSIYVTYYKVGELVEEVKILEAGQSQAHDDIDLLKVRIVQELYEIKLEVKDEQISRLETEVEFYKNK